MALKTITLGSMRNVIMYNDDDYTHAIETDGSISAESLDLSTLETKGTIKDDDMILIRDSEDSDRIKTCKMSDFVKFLADFIDGGFRGSTELPAAATMTLESEVI